MKKGVLIFLAAILMAALWIAVASGDEAEGVTYEIVTETGVASGVRYPVLLTGAPQSVLSQINASIFTDGQIEQALTLLRGVRDDGGWGVNVICEVTWRDDMISILFFREGKQQNGRWGQRTTGLVYRLSTGERVTAADLFSAQDAPDVLTAYAYEALEGELSTYMDARDIEPFPIDNFALTEEGLVFYYPSGQLCYLSGWAGGLTVPARVLNPLLAQAIPIMDIGLLQEAAAQGALPGVPVHVGDDIQAALDARRALHDADVYLNGLCYFFEDARMRGVMVISEGDHVERLQTNTLDICGLTCGLTQREAWRALLGEPAAQGETDTAEAARRRVPEGVYDEYAMGAYTLTLYADNTSTLQTVALEGGQP